MNTSVNELLSNPAFRPLVLLDVLAVFLMIIICLVFRRMRKGYYNFSYRLLGEAEYKEIWKKPSRRRF